jgi:hypothetical protein
VEHFYDVHRCLIDPRDPKRIYVTGRAGLYVTYTVVAAGNAGCAPNGLSMFTLMGLLESQESRRNVRGDRGTQSADLAQSGSAARAEGKIYRSRDARKNWQRLGGGLPEA